MGTRRRALLKESLIDISTATVTASQNYTYDGTAKTPSVTVKLDGDTIPSTGYDVAYSNNINAGTATITVTGKDGYKGTTTGSFTIAKASRTISFSPTYLVLDKSSSATKAATVSAGSSDGNLAYSMSSTYGSVNSSGTVTTGTTEGSTTVTATISGGANYEDASGTYTLYVFATTHEYAYSGSHNSLTLPPGTYKFQCWGAQGGSNAAYSSYGITAKSGGKGGYSEGQLSVSQATGIRVYVGGQGSSSAGGYNGGGGTSGTSQYNASNELGYSKMGGGGGATDIRLSDGELLSRMIVAGGGAGGAMCYKAVTTSTTTWTTVYSRTTDTSDVHWSTATGYLVYPTGNSLEANKTYKFSFLGDKAPDKLCFENIEGGSTVYENWSTTKTFSFTVAKKVYYIHSDTFHYGTFTIKRQDTTSSTTTSTDSQVGGVGGGTQGGGYSATYVGKQDSAGSGGSFGQGANQSTTGYRYCSGAGGGGWYGGGGGQKSDSTMSYCKYSGGGSGWVNIASSASNRPSGYTGLQLDSGTTSAGDTSFPNTAGTGNETGHSGNGYAKITRLD